MGGSEVYIFGSAIKGRLRTDSNVDLAVSGDLDDATPLVRYLRENGGLVRVA